MKKIIILSLLFVFVTGSLTMSYGEVAKKNKSWSKIKDIFK